MIPFHRFRDPDTGDEIVETPLKGAMLLDVPMLNKGSAFSETERREFELTGLLPPHVSHEDEQIARTYHNYVTKSSDLERFVYLASLHDRNETLFYKLLAEHVEEMLPIVYTPTVGQACQMYSHLYRRPRGLYLPYTSRKNLEELLRHAPFEGIRVIVVTDGERILGLGDLGIGGMGIPVGKLVLYSLCAGIHPAATLPVVLDAGTDNPSLLEDPLYIGWRHERVRGAEYDAFIEDFVEAVEKVFPTALLQWEDFAKNNARRLLDRYRDRVCSFNDDIQGTGAVTLAGLTAAIDVARRRWRDERVVLHGAGSAGTGIATMIEAAMIADGRSETEARNAIWLLDSRGLVHTGRRESDPAKARFATPIEMLADWNLHEESAPGLGEVVRRVRPTILVGTSADTGCFASRIVHEMARHVERPVIFPLSNPTSRSEAVPADLIAWTNGRALVATGSPFPPVTHKERAIPIGQCNNVFIFPGVGLGVLASGSRHVTDGMFLAASRALAAMAPSRRDPAASLYPSVADARMAAHRVALAVGLEAVRAGLAPKESAEDLEERVARVMWDPRYPRLRYRAEIGQTASTAPGRPAR